MWLQQIARKGSWVFNSKPHKSATTLKSPFETYHKGFSPTDLNDAATAITFLNINPNNSVKFRMKLKSNELKLGTIANEEITGGRKSDFSLGPDDDSEGDDQTDAEDKSPYRFEFLLRLFINLGYSICLIPFRLVPVTIGHKTYFEIRHHTLQRVISMIQCITASVVCFLVAYAQIGGQNIEKNPLVIFNFWSYAVFCSWCFLFTNIFWRKEHLILAIVNTEVQGLDMSQTAVNTPFFRNLDEVIAAIYFYGVVLEEIYHKSVFYLFPQVYGLQSAAEVYSGKAMHSLFVRNNTRPIPWSEISPVTLGVSIWHFVGWQSFGAIKSLFYIFVTFSSLFLIGRINRELRAVKRAIVLNSECHDEPSSKEIWSRFVEVRSTVRQINELTDLCVLGIYLILVPFLSSSFIQRWDSEFIEYKILMVLQFVWPLIALVSASEATRLGEKFLRAVKDGSEDVKRPYGLQCSAYFVYENANLSMTGWKFFNVSYGFMGATLSVVTTYGIVILGFLHDTITKKSKC